MNRGFRRGPLADLMVRDPFRLPVEHGASPELDRVLKSLYPERQDLRILLSVPASAPQSVIGAVVGGPCDFCGGDVWISPSTLRLLTAEPGLPRCCLACLEQRAVELGVLDATWRDAFHIWAHSRAPSPGGGRRAS